MGYAFSFEKQNNCMIYAMAMMIRPVLSNFLKQVGRSSTTASFILHRFSPIPIPIPTTAARFSYSSLDDSFTSPYLSATIFCHKDDADMLSEALLCFGAHSASMDQQDADEICITSTFPITKDVRTCISCAADSVGLKNAPNYHVQKHDHNDWIKEAQQSSFNPVKVKEGLWIMPQWKTSPDVQAINIVLNPGLAFGTGEHPTTKLCLLLLHDVIKGGEYFLDYGTGSGILAIAALKFGAAGAVGFDIDPQAIISARHNAALNKIEHDNLLLSLVPGNNGTDVLDRFPGEAPGLKDLYDKQVFTEMERYDIVVANILLNPLLDLADQIVSYAKPGAQVGLSGILVEQIPSVVERYTPLLDNIVVSKMDDWACISGHKRKG